MNLMLVAACAGVYALYLGVAMLAYRRRDARVDAAVAGIGLVAVVVLGSSLDAILRGE